MAQKADAWREYREAAMVEMLLDTLPKVRCASPAIGNVSNESSFLCFQVAAEVAAPLSQARKITMVSSGQGDIGAAKLTGEILQIVNKVPELVKNITGVDIARVRSNSEFI